MEELVKHNQQIGSNVILAAVVAFTIIILTIIICTYEFKRKRGNSDQGL